MPHTWELKDALGYLKMSKASFYDLVNAGFVSYWTAPGGKHRRYLKADVERLAMANWTPATRTLTPNAPQAQSQAIAS